MTRYATFTEYDTNAPLTINVTDIARVKPFDLKTGLILDRGDHWTYVNETLEQVQQHMKNAGPLSPSRYVLQMFRRVRASKMRCST